MKIGLSVPWTQQPQQATDIDGSNPLSRGLVSVINPAALNPKFTRVGTPSFGIVKDGRALSGTGASLVTEGSLSFGSAATIFMFGNMPSTGGALVCGIGTSSAGNQLFCFQSTDGSVTPHRALIRTVNGGGISSVESSLGIGAAPDIVPWCAVYDGTPSIKLYRNGIPDGVTISNTSASGAMSLDNFSLGGVNRGTDGFAPSGNVQLLGLAWNRALSPSEVASISANPWQIFKPIQKRLILNSISAGPTQYTLTCQGGAYTSTGASATLLKSKLLNASGGSYSAVGASAVISKSKLLTASGGAYVGAGSSAQILKSKLISASGGSYNLSGADAVITYTGSGPAVYTLTCQGGSYSISSAGASILKSKLLNASGGAYSVVGANANLQHQIPGQGGLLKQIDVLTGQLYVFKQLGN